MAAKVYLRTSDVATKVGCSEWRVRNAVKRGVLSPDYDSKRNALFTEGDPDKLRRALMGGLKTDDTNLR